MGVDHGGRDVAVAEELLDGADVVAGFEEVGREAVAEGVAGRRFGEARRADRLVEGALEDGFVESRGALAYLGRSAPGSST